VATIIDSLLVTLGLDSSGFQKGVKGAEKAQDDLTKNTQKNAKERASTEKKVLDEERKRVKQFQDGSKKTVDAIRDIRNQLIGVAALVTGGVGLARFTSDTISTAASVGRLSANIGESIQTIVGWQRAFENVGGTAEDATNSLTRASNAIGAFKSGRASPEIQGFLQMGGSISGGELSSAQSFLLAQSALIQKIAKQRGEAVAMYQAQAFMGIGAAEFNLLKQGPGAITSQVSRLGASSGMTKQSAEAAAQLQAKFNALKNTFLDTGRTVLLNLIPVFDRLLNAFQQLGNWVSAHRVDILNWVNAAIPAFISFASAINDVAQALGGWKNVFEGLVAIKFASLLGGLGSVLATVTSIASAAGLASSAIAAIAGYKLGEWVNKNFVEGTEFGDFLGEKITELTAIMGSKDAKEALETMHRFKLLQAASAESGNMMSIDAAAQSSPARSASNIRNSTSTTTSEVNVNSINIHTQATDAGAMAKDARPAIEKYMFVPQANTGVN